MSLVRRLLAGVIAVTVLVFAFAAPRAPETEAAFTDSEPTAATSFAAATLQPPVITGVTCSQSLQQGGTVQVQWRWPDTNAPYGSFTPANAQWQLSGGWQNVTTTGPVGSTYTSLFTQGLLGGLLTGILGGSFTVATRTASGTWASDGTSSFTYSNSILGLLFPPSCSYTNGA